MVPRQSILRMATDRLYWTEPRRQSFEATITAHVGDGVVLDRTAFYPTGGGQPGDTGALEWNGTTLPVTDVRTSDGIVHIVEGERPPVDTTVTGRIDWDRRWAHMRYHSAQHLLSAVLLDRFDAQTVGNQLYADRARLDCEHERFSDTDLEEIESAVSEHVHSAYEVTTEVLSRDGAESVLDPRRTRLERIPESVDPIRIVRIDDIDATACAGTHVARTDEIGSFQITGRETGGAGRERIRFVLDDQESESP